MYIAYICIAKKIIRKLYHDRLIESIQISKLQFDRTNDTKDDGILAFIPQSDVLIFFINKQHIHASHNWDKLAV